METDLDNIEVEINEMINELIYQLNERRSDLLMDLRIKRKQLRPTSEDIEIGKTLSRTRENLTSQKYPNKLQSMYRRMLIEVDSNSSDFLKPLQEIKFNRNTRDLETQIATLGEITLHELPILPPIPQRAATPDVSFKPDIDSPASVQQHQYVNYLITPKPRHVTQDPAQYLWGRMSREDCETLLLQRAKQGEFIFRESVRREEQLVLSMRYRDMIHHYCINQEDGWLCVGEDFRFRSIPEIISHYQKRRIACFREKDLSLVDILLSQPLGRVDK